LAGLWENKTHVLLHGCFDRKPLNHRSHRWHRFSISMFSIICEIGGICGGDKEIFRQERPEFTCDVACSAAFGHARRGQRGFETRSERRLLACGALPVERLGRVGTTPLSSLTSSFPTKAATRCRSPGREHARAIHLIPPTRLTGSFTRTRPTWDAKRELS